jgi:hypothetical protein
MFGTYLRAAFRNLKKQRPSAAISVVGLAIGLAFFALLAAYARDDLTFDRFHAKADRTYVLTTEFRDRFAGVSHHFVAGMLEADYPEVAPGSTVRYAMRSQAVRSRRGPRGQGLRLRRPRILRYVLLRPRRRGPCPGAGRAPWRGPDGLDRPGSGPLPRTLSGKPFRSGSGNASEEFAVTGLMSDIPGNSSLRFDGILPFRWVFDAFQVDGNNNDLVTLPMLSDDLPRPARTCRGGLAPGQAARPQRPSLRGDVEKGQDGPAQAGFRPS